MIKWVLRKIIYWAIGDDLAYLQNRLTDARLHIGIESSPAFARHDSEEWHVLNISDWKRA